MSKPKTANQYLASIGIGPVNPVCQRCGRETGRTYTADVLCVDCLIKQGQIIPQRPRKLFVKTLTCGHAAVLKSSARAAYCTNCRKRKRTIAGQSREYTGPRES